MRSPVFFYIFILLNLTATTAAVHAEKATSSQIGTCGAYLHSGDLLEQGPLRLSEAGLVKWNGRLVKYLGTPRAKGTNHFPETAWKILIALADYPDQMRTFQEIIDDVWPESEFGERQIDAQSNLQTQIVRIRRSFLAVDPNFKSIHQQRRGGYVWLSDPENPSFQGESAVDWKGEKVTLTRAQYLVLIRLQKTPGIPVTAPKLHGAYSSATGGNFKISDLTELQMTEVIAHHIKRIRSAFEKIDPEFNALKTIRGRGYSWDP